jgi:hypothetical protein
MSPLLKTRLKTRLKIRASLTFAILTIAYSAGRVFDTHNFEYYAAGLLISVVSTSAFDIYADRKKRSTR